MKARKNAREALLNHVLGEESVSAASVLVSHLEIAGSMESNVNVMIDSVKT